MNGETCDPHSVTPSPACRAWGLPRPLDPAWRGGSSEASGAWVGYAACLEPGPDWRCPLGLDMGNCARWAWTWVAVTAMDKFTAPAGREKRWQSLLGLHRHRRARWATEGWQCWPKVRAQTLIGGVPGGLSGRDSLEALGGLRYGVLPAPFLYRTLPVIYLRLW